MTNLEKIKNMNAEEMAKEIRRFDCDNCPCVRNCNTDCTESIQEWLESEVEE